MVNQNVHIIQVTEITQLTITGSMCGGPDAKLCRLFTENTVFSKYINAITDPNHNQTIEDMRHKYLPYFFSTLLLTSGHVMTCDHREIILNSAMFIIEGFN